MMVEIPNPNIAAHLPLIQSLVHLGATSILELGVDLGTGSTQAIRRGIEMDLYPVIRWVSVDLFDRIPPLLRPASQKWWFLRGDSRDEETVRKTMSGGPRFDFVFIDTVHTREHLRAEFAVWERAVSDNALWVFHDTWMNGARCDIQDAIIEFAERRREDWKWCDLTRECNGLGLLIPRQPTTRWGDDLEGVLRLEMAEGR